MVGRAVEVKLLPLNSWMKILSVDNGRGFADHQVIDEDLCIQTYFADPYGSWQRVSNKNLNGLLRQYISLKRRKETVSDEELTMIESRITGPESG